MLESRALPLHVWISSSFIGLEVICGGSSPTGSSRGIEPLEIVPQVLKPLNLIKKAPEFKNYARLRKARFAENLRYHDIPRLSVALHCYEIRIKFIN